MTTSRATKNLNPTNDPLRADIIKFSIALRVDPIHHHSKEYIINVLNRILLGTMSWNGQIEDYYSTGDQTKSEPDLFK